MARIEWVKQRLENWALWKERANNYGLGFARQSVLLSEPGGGYRESVIPIDDCEGALTEQAVQALRPSRPQLYTTLQSIYVDGIGIRAAARRAGLAESTIKAHLDQADHALSAWFGDRAEAHKKIIEKSLST